MPERLPRAGEHFWQLALAYCGYMREWSIPRVVRSPTFLIYASSLLFSRYGTIAPLASSVFPSVTLPPFHWPTRDENYNWNTLNNGANFFFAVTLHFIPNIR